MTKQQKTPGLLDPNTLPKEISRVDLGTEKKFKDGGGLYLLVTAAGTAKWVHRFPFRGRYPEMTLGDFPKDLTISEARALRDRNVILLEAGTNPLEAREAGLDLTFGDFVRKYRSRLAPPQQKAADSHSEWLIDMTERVGPLAKLKVSEVRFMDAEHAVKKYWDGERPRPSGVRITKAISRVLAFWHALERPEDDAWKNPVTLVRMKARLGNLEHHPVHYASMPFWDIPGFLPKLRVRPSFAAMAAEFVIFSGAPRVAETAAARWGELHWDGTMAGRRTMTWTIPADRRKTERSKGPEGKDHIVPINLGMLRVLNRARRYRSDLGPNDLIFPSYYAKGKHVKGKEQRSQAPMVYSGQAVLNQIRRAAGPGATVTTHGFRSSVLQWGVAIKHRKHEPFGIEIMDRVLSHSVVVTALKLGISPVVAEYVGKTDPWLARRRIVMREWSAFLNGRAPIVEVVDNVIPFERAA
jgi:Arm domain-containing DNA-binding protein